MSDELKVELEEDYKVMRVARQKGALEGSELEQVDEMKYLDVVISADGSMEKEDEARISNATRMIGGMSEEVLRRNELKQERQAEGCECHHDTHANVWM